MKVRYRESGGFAGLSRGCEVDSASLPGEDARRLAALVEQAAPDDVAAPSPPEARDLLGYEIVIESEARRTVLRFDDATIPERADPLLAWLQERARPLPLKPREDP